MRHCRLTHPHRFRLIDADPLDSGVVVLRYRAG
jgi:hypothetical protein